MDKINNKYFFTVFRLLLIEINNLKDYINEQYDKNINFNNLKENYDYLCNILLEDLYKYSKEILKENDIRSSIDNQTKFFSKLYNKSLLDYHNFYIFINKATKNFLNKFNIMSNNINKQKIHNNTVLSNYLFSINNLSKILYVNGNFH